MSTIVKGPYVEKDTFSKEAKCCVCESTISISEKDLMIYFSKDPRIYKNRNVYFICPESNCQQQIILNDIPKVVSNRIIKDPTKRRYIGNCYGCHGGHIFKEDQLQYDDEGAVRKGYMVWANCPMCKGQIDIIHVTDIPDYIWKPMEERLEKENKINSDANDKEEFTYTMKSKSSENRNGCQLSYECNVQ